MYEHVDRAEIREDGAGHLLDLFELLCRSLESRGPSADGLDRSHGGSSRFVVAPVADRHVATI